MSDPFEGYRFGPAWDQAFSGPGTPRSSHLDVHRSLQAITAPRARPYNAGRPAPLGEPAFWMVAVLLRPDQR
ncbi:hypothetical protein ABLG96_06140 [Nakamurella sp. A5-74]|uniref:Uncharacterized protein n=1 Tax=Nakamurella sp. A5-74 TaxID=3158264 RepID=A0AAU8DTC0_9ACTN